MKKLLTILMTLLLIFSMAAAYAAEPMYVEITAVDYQTGKAVSKTYVENELFTLAVDIEIPRFADLSNMELIVSADGVEIEEPAIELATGRYFITGIVTDQPASICVKIKDMAFEYADTAEEMYHAMQTDRSVSDCFKFYSASTSNGNLAIPKTGDYTVTGIVMLALCLLAIPCLYQTAKRAKR